MSKDQFAGLRDIPQMAAFLDRFAEHKAALIACLRQASKGRAFDADEAWAQLERVAVLYFAVPTTPRRSRSPDEIIAEGRRRMAPFNARFEAPRSLFKPPMTLAERRGIAVEMAREIEALAQWSKRQPRGRPETSPDVMRAIGALALVYRKHTGRRPAEPTFNGVRLADRGFPALLCEFFKAADSQTGLGAENLRRLIRGARKDPLFTEARQ